MVTRKHPRFPVSLSSTLVQKDRFRHAGSVRNISAKGCRIDSIISPFTGMQLTVQLHIPGECQKCNYREGRLLNVGLGLELLDHAVQSVLMRGGYRQEL